MLCSACRYSPEYVSKALCYADDKAKIAHTPFFSHFLRFPEVRVACFAPVRGEAVPTIHSRMYRMQ